jgi:hypothetical protein
MSVDTKYSPPTPTRQTFTPWRRDTTTGCLWREILAVEIEEVDPRDALNRLRIRLANSESSVALRAVAAAATALAERADDEVLRREIAGVAERCALKLSRAQAP